MMKNLRKVTGGLLIPAALITMWWSSGKSQDAERRKGVKSSPTLNVTHPSNQAGEKPGEMAAEEKLVRDVYARLMRYQSAAVDELAKGGKPADYLTFELRHIRSGNIADILDRRLVEMASPPGESVIALKQVHLGAGDGVSHAYYEAAWTASENKNQPAVAVKDAAGAAGFDRYTSYQVKVWLQGRQIAYRALVLSHVDNIEKQSSRPVHFKIIDNITSDMNLVYADESPRVRSPWQKYAKSSLYLAVTRTIKAARESGESIVPLDVPIGYLPGDDVVPTEADLRFSTNTTCPPDVTLKLLEVGWGGTGQIAMKKLGSGSPGNDWEDDPFGSEGDTAIGNPVWVDSNTDGTPNENEPVAFVKGSSPQLTGAKVKISPTLTTTVNAKIKVESGDELRFGVKDVVLTGSSINLPTFSTSDTVGSVVNNRSYTLHWSVSLNNGQSYTEFGTSTHKAFVTIAAPSGYEANPGVTARRIDFVSETLKGKSNLSEIAQLVGGSVAWNPGFSLYYFISDTLGNHWQAIDQRKRMDCISLAVLAVKELRQVGITSTPGRTYPTGGYPVGDSDTTAPEFDRRGRRLIFFAAGGANNFEGFYEILDGSTRKAFSVDPVLGPIEATTRPVSGDKLYYSVMKSTLDTISGPDPGGSNGRQFWFVEDTGIDFSVVIPFPTP